jgi:hypothetical protein
MSTSNHDYIQPPVQKPSLSEIFSDQDFYELQKMPQSCSKEFILGYFEQVRESHCKTYDLPETLALEKLKLDSANRILRSNLNNMRFVFENMAEYLFLPEAQHDLALSGIKLLIILINIPVSIHALNSDQMLLEILLCSGSTSIITNQLNKFYKETDYQAIGSQYAIYKRQKLLSKVENLPESLQKTIEI